MDAHLPLRAGMSHSIRLESPFRVKVEPFLRPGVPTGLRNYGNNRFFSVDSALAKSENSTSSDKESRVEFGYSRAVGRYGIRPAAMH